MWGSWQLKTYKGCGRLDKAISWRKVVTNKRAKSTTQQTTAIPTWAWYGNMRMLHVFILACMCLSFLSRWRIWLFVTSDMDSVQKVLPRSSPKISSNDDLVHSMRVNMCKNRNVASLNPLFPGLGEGIDRFCLQMCIPHAKLHILPGGNIWWT